MKFFVENLTTTLDKLCPSATLFRNLIYEIDDFNHRFNVTIPDTQSTVRNLAIWDEKGNLHVACTSGD
ncbi:MAG: hypothetical protein IJ733_12090 [Lachnospiraceae bacterium]|nr:hypothetical protein [Lachnospiraceae bacterium]